MLGQQLIMRFKLSSSISQGHHEKKLRDLGLFSLEWRRLKGSHWCVQIPGRRLKWRQSQAFLLEGQEALGTSWNTESSVWPSGSTVVLSTGTGCWEKLWGLLHGELQKLPRCGPGLRVLSVPAWVDVGQKDPEAPSNLSHSVTSKVLR